MNILITGGAGFVGANLAIYLRQIFPEANVLCLDNLYRRGAEINLKRLAEYGVKFQWGDVCNLSTFPSGPFDFIIECSAEPSVLAGNDSRLNYLIQTNLMGAYNCLEKAREWNSNFIFLSTSRVYPVGYLEAHPWCEELSRFTWESSSGSGITVNGVTETVPMNGARSLYGYTKYAAELLIEEYRASFGIKALVNRCGVIAGPWQFGKVDQGVFSLWVMAHYFGIPLSYIGYGGTGKQVRDVLHIHDLCELIAEQIQNFDSWDGWVGNVSGGRENSASLLELTELCTEITGKEVTINKVLDDRPNDLRIFIADCSQLFKRTHWRPKQTPKNVIIDITKWVQANESFLSTLVLR